MQLPPDPFDLLPHAAFAPAATRQISLFGAPVELLYLPDRAARRGRPGTGRSAFPAQFVDEILQKEAVWTGSGMVMTPNRYPFGRRQAVLWAQAPLREPDPNILELSLRLEEKVSGTVLMNSIGAAASIPRCHLHLMDERLGFLPQLPTVATIPAALEKLPPDITCLALAPPFPGLGLGVRGPARERARIVHDLLHARTTPAFNLVSQDSTTWVFPRSAEIPAPHFPHALGCAEFWGRWCFGDEEAFRAATPDTLEAALRASCYRSVD